MKYGLRFDFRKMIADVLIEVAILALMLLAISHWLYG